MKKFLILLTILILIAQPLMAASFNATHKSILEAKLEKLLEIDGNDVRSMTLAAIALKEYLNLVAENLILLSEDEANNAVVEDLYVDFLFGRELYNTLVARVTEMVQEDVWHLELDPPLHVSPDLQQGAAAYSVYLVEIARGLYPESYEKVHEAILNYLPIAYQNRLFLLSVDAPTQDEIARILLSEETAQLSLDLQKTISALSGR
jgi:hypothetical protein